MHVCESFVGVQECISLVCLSECGRGMSLLSSVSSFLALSTTWNIMPLFASSLLRVSAPRGQDLVYFVHRAIPSTHNVLGTSGHSV